MDATVAERGQVVIPKAMRDLLGITPGMQLSFSVEDGKLVIRKKVDDAISRVRGRFTFEPGDDLDAWARDMRGRAPSDPIEPWEALRDDMFIPAAIRDDHAKRRAVWLAEQSAVTGAGERIPEVEITAKSARSGVKRVAKVVSATATAKRAQGK